MENLQMIIKAVLLLGGIGVGIAVLMFPVVVDLQYYGENGKHILNYWMTVIELICIFTVYTYIPEWGSDGSTEALGFLCISIIVSWILAVKKAKKLGIQGVGVSIVVIAQILSPVSIIFILLSIAGLAEKISGKSKKH